MFDQPQSSPFPITLDAYTGTPMYDQNKQGHPLEFATFNTGDIAAPSVDLFESELDLLTQDHEFNFQLTQVDNVYPFLATTPTCGPGSAITYSTESAYDSLSSHSESFYNFPHSPPSSSSNYSFSLDFDMDFQRVHVDGCSDFGNTQSGIGAVDGTVDPTSFGTLPPTPPRSPPAPHPGSAKTFDKPYVGRTSFSDYSPPKRSNVPPDYYNQLAYNSLPHSTVSPSHISNPLPVIPQISTPRPPDNYKDGDPRKKYKCSVCHRAFARAFNLKTHTGTHDPNRPKPFMCEYRNCGRSFSRKHDLGRHLVSIHREQSVTSSHLVTASKNSIGIEKGQRYWCDNCGRSSVGRAPECNCNDK